MFLPLVCSSSCLKARSGGNHTTVPLDRHTSSAAHWYWYSLKSLSISDHAWSLVFSGLEHRSSCSVATSLTQPCRTKGLIFSPSPFPSKTYHCWTYYDVRTYKLATTYVRTNLQIVMGKINVCLSCVPHRSCVQAVFCSLTLDACAAGLR